MKTALPFFLIAMIGAFAANGADKLPVPAGAGFRVEFDKAEYLLGENILAHAILTNEGTENFRASFGGDYGELGRQDRYKIAVTDADGTILPDPLERKRRGIGGGLGSSPDLKPGEKWVDSLPLCDFVHFPGTGRYRVRITHDFGWSVGERKPPVADSEIVVRMPSPEEAEALVEKAAAEKFNGGVVGKRSPEHASYAALYHAIFLPALRRVAEQGDAKAVGAISDIESPDATEALIALANAPAADVSSRAMDSLFPRVRFLRPLDVPFPKWPEQATLTAVQTFSERCWKPELAAPLAAQARRLLAHGSESQRQHAIVFLGRVGDAQDIAPILECIQTGLFNPPKIDTDVFLADPPPFCRAGVAALQRLNPAPAQIKGDAGLYYLILAAPYGKAELKHLHSALESARPALRQAALRAMPQPLPDEFREAVRAALTDQHAGVCSAAADIVAKDKDSSYRPAVIALLKSERNIWAIRSATNAAVAMGVRYEAASAWAAQLDDARHWSAALSALAEIMVGIQSGGGTTTADRTTIIALRKRWETFLAKNERDIRKGRVFRPGESALPENLFSPHRQIHLKDGTDWPPAKSPP